MGAAALTLPIQPCIYNEKALNECNDIFDVTAQLAYEQPQTIFKGVYTGLKLGQELGYFSPTNETVNEAITQFTLLKLGNAPRAFLKKANDLREKANKYLENKESAWQVFLAANNCISPIYDGTDFFTRTIFYLYKNAPWFQHFTGVNAASLILGSSYNSYCDLSKIAHSDLDKAKTNEERRFHFKEIGKAFLDLIKDVSFLALGILVFLSTFFAFVFPSISLVALTASTVVFTVLNYYYTNLGAKKGQTSK